MLYSDAQLQRIWRLNIRTERLNGLGVDRDGAGKKLGPRGRPERREQVYRIARSCPQCWLQRSLTIENLLVDHLIGLNIGVEQSGTAADDGPPRSCDVPCKPEARLEEQVVVVVRCLNAALQMKIRIEDPEIIVVTQAKIQCQPRAHFPIILEPEADVIGRNVDVEISEALHVTLSIGAERGDVPRGGVVPHREDLVIVERTDARRER